MTITETKTETPDLPAWSLHWRGQVFSESELTGRHLSILALIVGNDEFSMLDMNPTLGHQRIQLMLSTFLAAQQVVDVTDVDAAAEAIAKAMTEIADAPAEEILGSIRFE